MKSGDRYFCWLRRSPRLPVALPSPLRGYSGPGSVSLSHPAVASPTAGFSLIELLIVVALILLLTTLYWSPSRGSRQRQLKKSCQANLEKIYISLQIYANDSTGHFPVITGAQTSEEALAPLVPRYSSDTALFLCPASKDSVAGDTLLKSKISYAYYMGLSATNSHALMSDAQVNTLAKVPGQDAFSSTGKPPGANHGKYGGNFLFCDGHAESSPAETPFPLELGPGVKLLNP